jgi:hypothetical protein
MTNTIMTTVYDAGITSACSEMGRKKDSRYQEEADRIFLATSSMLFHR